MSQNWEPLHTYSVYVRIFCIVQVYFYNFHWNELASTMIAIDNFHWNELASTMIAIDT